MRIAILNSRLEFTWIGLSVYLSVMVLLCSLGLWQLDRSEQKKQLLLQQDLALSAPALDLNRQSIPDVEAVRYRAATLKGRFDSAHQFMLDNQIVDGKVGYFVLTPFVLEGQDKAILVNRGWLVLGKDRNTLPKLEVDAMQIQVEGRINQFPSVGIKLKGVEIPTKSWPAVVQVIDSKVLSEILGYQLLEFQIELDPSYVDGYKREWKINIPIPPEKHLAYAVQWFGLALTLTVLYIWISNKRMK